MGHTPSVFFKCIFRNYFCNIIKGKVIREELFLSIENAMSQCRQFGLNFTLPKFQEDIMEHLGAREQYTNLGSCTTKTLRLHYIFLKLWRCKIQIKLLPIMTFSGR